MAGQKTSTGDMFSFLEEHPALSIGGVLLVLFVVGGMLTSKVKTPATAADNAPGGDLSGLTNHNLVYVPTQTTFSTQNIGADFSNDPNLQTIQTGPILTNSPVNKTTQASTSSSTTTNQTATGGGIISPGPVVITPPVIKVITPPAPPRAAPPPAPAPPQKAKGLIWDQRYSIRGGDTLSAIAATLTRQLRAAGMPGSQSVGWPDLYAHNTQVINATSAAHHNPIPGGPWNDIFPGEVITVPRWG